ncbi:hypothetical protein Q3G72_027151 [Acer saccharum]|nr:hypothetical protein Q3G72_027151 [Acer saccharum]
MNERSNESIVIIGEAAKESLSNLSWDSGKQSWGCLCVPTEQCSYDSFQDLITCDMCNYFSSSLCFRALCNKNV